MTKTEKQASDTATIQPWSLDGLKNVGQALAETAERMPGAIAVACPKKKQARDRPTQFDLISFAELDAMSNRIARGVQGMGVLPGTRIALMVPPGIDFVAWVFGLFKAGVVVILIDPGMGRKNMIGCLAEAKPAGMVGVPLAHLARTLFRFRFTECKKNVVLGYWPGCRRAAKFAGLGAARFELEGDDRENEAAIIFTTGSTGPPKGVLYRHRIFIEQAGQIRDYFDIRPGAVDVSGFPLFALFNTAMGATTVFPKMDATRPAAVHPPEIIHAAREFAADQSFGSPALWNTVSLWCEKTGERLPTIRRVFTAGAPVPAKVLRRIKLIIAEDGEAFTPYGATEALPVACNAASVVLGETEARTDAGEGTCVGNRFPEMEWRVIRITDGPLPEIGGCEEVARGEIGELIVRGAVVTDRYVTRTSANAEHKIRDGETFWHRMGDVGYLDSQDRFWFCGRKGHRVITAAGAMFTIPCEGIINTHSAIYRSALVGAGERGSQIPVIVAEPLEGQWPVGRDAKERLIGELLELASRHWQTEPIKRVYLHRGLPVDIRHNSKIFREKLKIWAEAMMKEES